VRQTNPVYPTKQGERVRVLVKQIDPVYPINEGGTVEGPRETCVVFVLVRVVWDVGVDCDGSVRG
jgi:hypothetical protein